MEFQLICGHGSVLLWRHYVNYLQFCGLTSCLQTMGPVSSMTLYFDKVHQVAAAAGRQTTSWWRLDRVTHSSRVLYVVVLVVVLSTSAGFLDMIRHLARPMKLQPQRHHDAFVLVVALHRFIVRSIILFLPRQLCTIISTLRWAVLTVLWIGFCHTGCISLCIA